MSNNITAEELQDLFIDFQGKSADLDGSIKSYLEIIAKKSETQKGVLAVVLTGLVYKHFNPSQDVRYHQTTMDKGYSGRSFDTRYITPFLRKNDFPSMAESGWLTRSLEQNFPYTLDYNGQISDQAVKRAFLQIYDTIETSSEKVDDMLIYLFQKLIEERDSKNITLSRPTNLTIKSTLDLLKGHIEFSYHVSGGARLPNLAVYAAYQCFIEDNLGRYSGKILMPLNSHTASDTSTGAVGDIQINNEANSPFEGIEIKAKEISPMMVQDVYRKIQGYPSVSRYYILSTHKENYSDEIEDQIARIRSKHGCDVIVNGVYTTLKYFLRLSNTNEFIAKYVSLMELDKDIKYEHKAKWNELCSSL